MWTCEYNINIILTLKSDCHPGMILNPRPRLPSFPHIQRNLIQWALIELTRVTFPWFVLLIQKVLSTVSTVYQSLSYQELVVGSNMDRIYIVMDYVEHDIKALMETMKQPFLEGAVHYSTWVCLDMHT